MTNKKQNLIEIARSFEFKHNLGDFENVTFFCSQKAECKEEEAEKTSEALYEFCKNEVIKSLNAYLKEKAEKLEKKENDIIANSPTDEEKNSSYGKQTLAEKYNENSELDNLKVDSPSTIKI